MKRPSEWTEEDQYFEVGEEVVLVSELYPERDGDAVVLAVTKGATLDCVRCGKHHIRKESSIGYQLDIEAQGCCNPWLQKALRKKYKGSGDFEVLMGEMAGEIKVGG